MGFPAGLRIIIKKSGLSRGSFAEKSGISRSQLFNYLNGKCSPSLTFLMNLRAAFPWVDINVLSENDADQQNNFTESPYYKRDIIDRINLILEDLPIEQMEYVLKYVEEKKLLSLLFAEEKRK